MTVIPIKIPQLGEGLQEARLVEFLKQPGDRVERDECIFVMETDKAISEIEATDAGTLVEWTVDPDSVVPIGSEVGRLDVGDAAVVAGGGDSHGSQAAAKPAGASQAGAVAAAPMKSKSVPRPDVRIPPRTRKYLKDHGLLEVAGEIPTSGTKLMPADVDRYLAAGGTAAVASMVPAPTVTNKKPRLATSADFVEAEVPSAQQTLIYRMARGVQVVLPAVLETEIEWGKIAAARAQVKASGGGPTGFGMFLWCVTQAMRRNPMLRSSMSADSKVLRTYNHVNLGVAVSLDGDELKTAVVREADILNQAGFFWRLSNSIAEAREGKDQIDASTTVSVSNIGVAGMRSGIPLVVTPAVATIAIGEVRAVPVPTEESYVFKKVATLTMSFDHRLLNGVGAANFLNDVRETAANFALEP